MAIGGPDGLAGCGGGTGRGLYGLICATAQPTNARATTLKKMPMLKTLLQLRRNEKQYIK